MNRAQRRRSRNRSKSFILGASLATGALVGYVGYSRVLPSFASTTCVVNDNGTGAGDSTNKTFAYCLADTNVSTITFDSSISRITMDSANRSGFQINRSLTIDGISGRSSRMIFDGDGDGDGSGDYSIFAATAGPLTLQGLELRNGYSVGDAGAVNAVGSTQVDVYMTDVVAENNKALFNGGFLFSNGNVFISGGEFNNNYARDLGGAIIASGTVTLYGFNDSNPSFDNNSSTGDGGAIYALKDVFIQDSTSFTNNSTSGRGGAIHVGTGQKITVSDTATFSSNTSNGQGGAIYSRTVELTGNAIFTSNFSNFTGGAIHAVSGLTISGDPTFTSNSSIDNGGAIYKSGASGIVISGDAKFYDNGNVTAGSTTYTAQKGGAVYSTADVTISGNVVFNGNYAATDGGAVYSRGDVTVTETGGGSFGADQAGNESGLDGGAIKAENFTSNSSSLSFTDNLAGNDGGAIYTLGSSGFTSITGKTYFSKNEAGRYGGAISSFNVTLDSTSGNESVFDDNDAGTSGGAVFAHNDVTITHADFKYSDAATDKGGAVYAFNSATVSYATFLNNVASVSGGAISVGDDFDIDDSSFTSNDAGTGGALSAINGFTKSYIDDSTFTTNRATVDHGGAVYLTSADLEINGSIFTSNISAQDGGAVRGGSDMAVGTSSFDSNIATAGTGGAIYSKNETDILESYFKSNQADRDGGAVYSWSTATVNDSLFYGNTAGSTYFGGGLYARSKAYVNNSTFYKNSASRGSAIFSQSGSGDSFLNFVTVYKNYVTGHVDDVSAAVYLSTGFTYNSIISGNVTDGSSTGLDFKVTGTAYAFNTLFSADGTANGGRGEAINDSYADTNSRGGNITFGSPRLAALADNGGSTKTLKPRFGSPAIDTAQTSFTQPASGKPLELDQRGQARVFGGRADLGAVELQSVPTAAQFTITVSAGANGSISPSGNQTVNELSDNSFTVTPNANYKIASVTVDGVSETVTDTSTFSYSFDDVEQNHSIAATFEPITHTITVTQGANGTIAPSTKNVNQGSDQTFTVTPDAGYQIASVTVDGVSQTVTDSSAFSYTFTGVNATGTISATFEAIPHTITVTQGANGTISPATTTVNQGSDQTFTVTPDAGYQIASVSVNGNDQTINDPTSFSFDFTNVNQAGTIAATFEPITHTITVTQGANGTIAPSTKNVNQGSDQTFTVTPDAGYQIASVTVDGVSQTVTDSSAFSYTFTGVNATGTIAATFEVDPSAPAPAPENNSGGGGGGGFAPVTTVEAEGSRLDSGQVIEIDANKEETVLFTGTGLDLIDSVMMGDTELSFQVSDSSEQITVTIPTSVAGEIKVEFFFGQNKIEQSVMVKEAISPSVVNAGSFKGVVAIYAKNFEGKRLSAKVGKDWVVVDELESNFVRVVEPVRWVGQELAVRIFIDRKLVRTVHLITK